MLKTILKVSSLLAALALGYLSWYPLLSAYIRLDALGVVLVFSTASLLSILFSLLMYRVRITYIKMSVLVLLVILYITYLIFQNIDLFTIPFYGFSLALSSFAWKYINTILSSSPRVPRSLKEKLLEFASRRAFIFSSLGCVLLAIITYLCGEFIAYGIAILLFSVSSIPFFKLGPFSMISVSREGEELPRPLLMYALMLIFALNITRPYIPAYLSYIGFNVAIISLFYAGVVVAIRAIASIAQLVVTIHGPHTALLIRGLGTALLILTAATSEHVGVSAIALGIAIALSPFHSLGYTVLASKVSKWSLLKAETLYTFMGIPASAIGLMLWIKDPRAILLFTAILSILSLAIMGKIKKLARKGLMKLGTVHRCD